jgi:transcriptional regulator with XRE-family HTH domain
MRADILIGTMSRAHTRLKELADRNGWTTVRLAELLGCSQPAASRLLAGKRKPGTEVAARLQERLGISVGEWFKEDAA